MDQVPCSCMVLEVINGLAPQLLTGRGIDTEAEEVEDVAQVALGDLLQLLPLQGCLPLAQHLHEVSLPQVTQLAV